MTDSEWKPDLESLKSHEVLIRMGKIIEESRRYFNDVCTGIGHQLEGDLAYIYVFTLTRDGDPNFFERIFGGAPAEFSHNIMNDEYHELWVPKNGDIMPFSWAREVQEPYTKLPIKGVDRALSVQAQLVKERLEEARSSADGIANMQSDDFDAISVIPTALGEQNQQLHDLITQLSNSGKDAQSLKQNIEDNWDSGSSRLYANRIDDFKGALIQLSEASDAMKVANVTVATHIGELMGAILELWRARIEGMDQAASSVMGGAKDLVGLLTKPTVIGVVSKVLDIVMDVVIHMATKDVADRIEKLKALGDMANKLAPIESAEAAAGEVSWPELPIDTVWEPK